MAGGAWSPSSVTDFSIRFGHRYVGCDPPPGEASSHNRLGWRTPAHEIRFVLDFTHANRVRCASLAVTAVQNGLRKPASWSHPTAMGIPNGDSGTGSGPSAFCANRRPVTAGAIGRASGRGSVTPVKHRARTDAGGNQHREQNTACQLTVSVRRLARPRAPLPWRLPSQRVCRRAPLQRPRSVPRLPPRPD